MTLADKFRANAIHEIGEDYVWGAEGSGGIAGDDDYDCSGFTWAMFRDVGINLPRLTAEGYRRRGIRIARPKCVGDFGVLLRPDGTARHIAPFIGYTDVVEAKGRDFGVVRTTVAAFNDRGAEWYRFPGVELGDLTAPRPRAYPGYPIKPGATGTNVLWIQRRLIHHGFKLPRFGADGDFGAETAAAVKAFRLKTFKTRPQGYNVGPLTWKALAK